MKINYRDIPRSILHRVLTTFWLRDGRVCTSIWGPFRGLKFHYVHPQMYTRGMIMLFYAAFEPHVTSFLARHIHAGATVYIAGGYIGVYAVYVARLMQSQGRVYVFEGWPENFALMQKNIDLNRRPNVEVIALPVCIAETSGTGVMVRGRNDSMNRLTAEADNPEGAVEVETVALDDVWKQTGHDPALILLDIEGRELEALKGAQALLAACRPCLVLEHHGRAAALANWLATCGYTTEPLGQSHLVAKP
ncbi:MAG TPA: FkbM family methyltransferase [Spirillospora sp.]|nr:FkbM family methyltransferase [Spirillospora sp.]